MLRLSVMLEPAHVSEGASEAGPAPTVPSTVFVAAAADAEPAVIETSMIIEIAATANRATRPLKRST
jgi:hypothetical protein